MDWQPSAINRLLKSVNADGGWPYELDLERAAEPTAFACLALTAADGNEETIQRGLKWLLQAQRDDGGVAASRHCDAPCWATAAALLAWCRASAGTSESDRSALQDSIQRGVDWLLLAEGKTFKSNPAIYGHNTLLTAWSWVAGTHSWVEPTAMAILALRAAGKADHPRVREAIALLYDRALPSGGWNYGNSVVFGNALRAFPAQTGMVLAALAGEQRNLSIDRGLEFLQGELPDIRSPFSLAWGLMGLTAWYERPSVAAEWLTQCARRLESNPPHPLYDSLLLLADASTMGPMGPIFSETAHEIP